MSKFGDVKQKDRLFSSVSPKIFLQDADELPAVSSDADGLFVQTAHSTTREAGVVYTKKTVDRTTDWKRADVTDFGATTNPVFQTKRLTQDAIFLRWVSGKDAAGKWAYDVVVRKLGVAPQNPNDGEIVGYSSVRNQFAHPVDSNGNIDVPDWMIETERSNGFIVPVVDAALQYTYKIFSVSTSGDYAASEAIHGYWTYPDIQDVITAGVHQLCFRIGDILSMPENSNYVSPFHAQVASFNYTYNVEDIPAENMLFLMMESPVQSKYDESNYLYKNAATVKAVADNLFNGFPKDDFRDVIDTVTVLSMSDNASAPSDGVAGSRFWIPSYMEVYGRYPIGTESGKYDAAPSDSIAGRMWLLINPESPDYNPSIEGHQFDLFKQFSGSDLQAVRLRYNPNGETCQWYLRTPYLMVQSGSVPQTFYVPNNEDTNVVVNVNSNSTYPVFCFRIAKKASDE